jgi:AraC-like DNA-binding protein
MDPLSDILTGLRIRRAMFTRLDASAPWGFDSTGEPFLKFVLLVRGSAILTMPNSPEPVALRSGDVFIMLQDQQYRIYDHEDSVTTDCIDIEKLRIGNKIEVGGGGAVTSFVSGFFELDAQAAKPLVKVLPPLLHLKLDKGRSLDFHSVLELLARETEMPGLGSDVVLSRLFELLFIHAIRAYSAQPGGPTRGWLGANADRQLAQALNAIHGEPARDWTVESLARVAGMSRSAFAARFKAVVEQTPLEYLTQWRMYCATRLLQRSSLPLAEVSRQVGYESVAAFHRVFRRETAMTPAVFRKVVEPAGA